MLRLLPRAFFAIALMASTACLSFKDTYVELERKLVESKEEAQTDYFLSAQGKIAGNRLRVELRGKKKVSRTIERKFIVKEEDQRVLVPKCPDALVGVLGTCVVGTRALSSCGWSDYAGSAAAATFVSLGAYLAVLALDWVVTPTLLLFGGDGEARTRTEETKSKPSRSEEPLSALDGFKVRLKGSRCTTEPIPVQGTTATLSLAEALKCTDHSLLFAVEAYPPGETTPIDASTIDLASGLDTFPPNVVDHLRQNQQSLLVSARQALNKLIENPNLDRSPTSRIAVQMAGAMLYSDYSIRLVADSPAIQRFRLEFRAWKESLHPYTFKASTRRLLVILDEAIASLPR